MQICHNVSASCTVYVNMSYNMVPVAVVVKPVYNVKQFLEPKKKKLFWRSFGAEENVFCSRCGAAKMGFMITWCSPCQNSQWTFLLACIWEMILQCKQRDKPNMQRAVINQVLSKKECHILATLHSTNCALKWSTSDKASMAHTFPSNDGCHEVDPKRKKKDCKNSSLTMKEGRRKPISH